MNPSVNTSRLIRHKQTPAHLEDYVRNSSNSLVVPSTSGIPYPIFSFHSFEPLSSNHKSFSMSITHDSEPKTYEESYKDKNWKIVMNSELEALDNNGTSVLVNLPPHVKPIRSRSVYKIKQKLMDL